MVLSLSLALLSAPLLAPRLSPPPSVSVLPLEVLFAAVAVLVLAVIPSIGHTPIGLSAGLPGPVLSQRIVQSKAALHNIALRRPSCRP